MQKLTKLRNGNSQTNIEYKTTSSKDKVNLSEMNVPLHYLNKNQPVPKRIGFIDRILIESKEKAKKELVNENEDLRREKEEMNCYSDNNNMSISGISLRKEEKDKNSFININDYLVDNLNLEIEEYKVPNKYESHYAMTKQKKKELIMPRTKRIRNENNDININSFFKTSLLFKKNTLNNFYPENVAKRNQQLKRMPYIIKCMDKKRNNSIYNQPIIDKWYVHRYRKPKVNLEDILLNHNTNERRDLSSAKVQPYIIFKSEKKNNQNKKTPNIVLQSTPLAYKNK